MDIVQPLVIEDGGQRLTFDPEDIESFEFSMGYDVHDDTPADATAVRNRLGAPKLTVIIKFKDDAPPRWRKIWKGVTDAQG